MPEAPLLLDCDVARRTRDREPPNQPRSRICPDGGPVEVSALEEDGLAVVRVEDSGIGNPAVDRERLFELGFRTDKAAAVAPSLGLGLYIAAAIVRRHAGTLEAAERDLGGSVFTARLPLVGGRHSAIVGAAERGSHGSPYQYAS